MTTNHTRRLALAGLVALAGSLAACSADAGDIRADLIDQVADDDSLTDTQKQCVTDLANDTSDADIEKINEEFEDIDDADFDPSTLSPEGSAFIEGVTTCLLGA
jgi:uncharacterized protein YpuA (DUF1002 family)